MKAIVMAGGEGSRLRPITANRPKPLAPVANRPIMEHILLLLKAQGITEVIATVYYLADYIEGYFGDGSDWGMSIHYSLEDTPLGTAGSVKQAEEHLRDGTFVIISGDALTDIDLQPAIEFHRRNNATATLVLARVPNPLEFGVVITREDGRITRFLEKPSWSEVFSDTVNTGIYILEPEIFEYMEPGKQYDFSQDLFPLLLREGKPLYGYIMREYWSDIGTLQQYREAHYDLLNRKVRLPLPGEEKIPGVWTGAGATIDPEAQIVPPVCIGRNCRIKKGAVVGPYTTLGDNCIVEPNATVVRSIVWDSVYIGAGAQLQGAVVGTGVTIEDNVQVQEDAVIADRCHIESDSIIRTRVKLWPDKYIESGSTVTMSLIWGARWRGSLFRDLGVAGLSNIEMTPDLATKLGAAYASTLPRGSTIVLARDTFNASRMIKHAFMAGVLSTGVDVADLRAMPIPITRHYIRASGAAGGVSVRVSPTNVRMTLIEFYDRRGIYLPKSGERKIENLFFREDFARCDADEVGEIHFASRAIEQYQADFHRLVQLPKNPRAMRLVADFAFSRVAAIFPAMLGEMGYDVVSLNAYPDPRRSPRTPAEHDTFAEKLKQVVQSLNAECGVMFENEGERLTVVDEKGRIISGSALLATFARLMAEACPGKQIAVPVNAPSVIEEVVAPFDVQVIRTRADVRSLMNTAAEHADTLCFAGDTHGGFIFPQFHPGYDAMFAYVRLLEATQRLGCCLSEVYDQIPSFYTLYQAVSCPWELKGRVMRLLAQEVKGRVETIDGLKVYTDHSWALVLPDAAEPMIHLYVEARTLQAAEQLLREFALRIEQLTQKE
ncbi:MAG: mannose-1-phosphate guanyltransferase [Fimbriimonadales bacterium]|nr:mannose-1-phosphate guanyltransferase [Fimbriimonadales bacterium]MCS7190535.1 mannose-1-phosphate guanyltransferase [Fimbriimonadales bacterium]